MFIDIIRYVYNYNLMGCNFFSERKKKDRKTSPARTKKSGCCSCGCCCSLLFTGLLLTVSSLLVYQLVLVNGDFSLAIGIGIITICDVQLWSI